MNVALLLGLDRLVQAFQKLLVDCDFPTQASLGFPEDGTKKESISGEHQFSG